MGAITKAELARRLGVTRSAVTQAIAAGRLEPALLADGKLDADLAEHLFRATSRRCVEPVVHQPGPEDVAAWSNALLDLPQWGPPPWDVSHWVTLRDVIETAQELAQRWSYSPEKMQEWGEELEIELNEQLARFAETPSAR